MHFQCTACTATEIAARRARGTGELASQAALGLLSSEAREAHDLLYETAFASADEAERVESSATHAQCTAAPSAFSAQCTR